MDQDLFLSLVNARLAHIRRISQIEGSSKFDLMACEYAMSQVRQLRDEVLSLIP